MSATQESSNDQIIAIDAADPKAFNDCMQEPPKDGLDMIRALEQLLAKLTTKMGPAKRYYAPLICQALARNIGETSTASPTTTCTGQRQAWEETVYWLQVTRVMMEHDEEVMGKTKRFTGRRKGLSASDRAHFYVQFRIRQLKCIHNLEVGVRHVLVREDWEPPMTTNEVYPPLWLVMLLLVAPLWVPWLLKCMGH
jgi:hypothetical protein